MQKNTEEAERNTQATDDNTAAKQANADAETEKQEASKSKHRASRGRTGGISGIISSTTTTHDRYNEQRVDNARKRTKRTVLTDGHVRGV